jgi:hypothetical protein
MKAYICCTKEKFHGKNLYIPDEFDCFPDDESSKPYFAKEPIIEENDRLANGSIVAECEVKEAFKIEFCGTSIKHPAYFFPSIHAKEVLGRSCLTEKQFTDYGKGKPLYAYHLENVKPVELDLYDFYEDEACTKPLTKAPQSYRFAYRRHNCTDEEARMINYYWDSDKWLDSEGHECFQDFYCWYYIEKCLIFSIRSPWLCKIANGEKDLEVRKTRILNAGIEYK